MRQLKKTSALLGAILVCIFSIPQVTYAAETTPVPPLIADHLRNDGTQIVPQTSNSGNAGFGSGVTLTANAWIQPVSNWSGCGQFKTSAVMNRSPKWIRNTTTFYQIGFGSLNIKGLSIESSRSGNNTLVWTNNNGAKGSYLSGSVCGGWGSLYLGMDVTGVAFYNGTTRVASAHI